LKFTMGRPVSRGSAGTIAGVAGLATRNSSA